MTALWAFLLVLSGLILVHELGHFLVARSFGIRVLKFSIGFGPRLWGVKRGGTDFCISAFPLGGFVKMLGEQPDEKVPQEEVGVSFSHKPAWQRAAVVLAGPMSNLFFAWFLFFLILLFYGKPVLLPDIGGVQPGSPAEASGVRAGDSILEIDGRPISSWEEVSEMIRGSRGGAVKLLVLRDKEQLTIVVSPRMKKMPNIFGEQEVVPVIGITAAGNLRLEKLNPAASFVQAFDRTWDMIVLTGRGFVKIIERVVPLSSLGGPIMIAQMAGQQAEQGMLNLFYFMALISINLGILNLLPIPVLDGGHLFFYIVEAVTGRPLSMRQMEIAQYVGILFIGALMLLVFYNDIARLLGILPKLGAP